MKNLLSIVVSCDLGEKYNSTLYDGIEIIYPEENETEKDFILRAAKNAKCKYAVLLDKKFMFADVNSLLNILDKNSSDMVCFTGGTAIKTSVVKSVAKDCADLFSCFSLSVLNCKTVLKSTYMPFTFERREVCFTEANYSGILISAEAFGAAKAKLTKDVYSYVLNALCTRLIAYYLFAIVAIKSGEMESEKLVSFDSRLKSEIVLYLALEKNFTYAKLVKLRKKNFKISRFTAKKFKKILKSK
ncbi:MAG: hypothetical protein K2N23_07330 [Clostridia bacterium]|nr:hypothetical protein [Clostridia bacterium]